MIDDAVARADRSTTKTGPAFCANESIFSRWNPDEYLREYYTRIEAEEEHTLRFLVEQSARVPNASMVLEFGCGPTLHHTLPFARRAAAIHVADLLPQNLEAIRRWQAKDPHAHDWRPFTRRVLAFEGSTDGLAYETERREEAIRKLIKRRLQADARRSNPLGSLSRAYDCVVSCYCADSATADKQEWRRLMLNIASLIAPGGLLLIAALRRCKAYTVGMQSFPSAQIEEDDLASVFEQLGLREVGIEAVELPNRATHGFESIVLASATAPGRTTSAVARRSFRTRPAKLQCTDNA